MSDHNIGTAKYTRNGRAVKRSWTPPPPRWYKWNTGASRIDRTRSTTIGFVWQLWEDFRHVGTTVGDCPILIAETLTIREAIRTIIRMNIKTIIVESDSQVAINSITDKKVALKKICNLVHDKKFIDRNFKNIWFTYCSRSFNFLADRMQKAHLISCNGMQYFFCFNIYLYFLQTNNYNNDNNNNKTERKGMLFFWVIREALFPLVSEKYDIE